jgi:hypothetical protein
MACSDASGPDGPGIPVTIAAAARVSPENVLSARVVFSAGDADSVAVAYRAGNDVRTTRFRAAKAGTDTIIVLGLRPETDYRFEVVARANGLTRSSAEGGFRTASLPAALANVKMVSLAGSPSRHSITGVNGYAVVFDTTGAIVWYHDFTATGLPVGTLMLQPNGNLTAFLGASSGWQPIFGYYSEFTPEGEEVATYSAPPGYYMDDHDLLLSIDGGAKKAHYFTYDIRTMDLTHIGGHASVATAGHQIRRASAGGDEFVWDAWGQIGVEEWVGDMSMRSTRTSTDFDHPNALTFDLAGNYVVSWRNLNQVMAINAMNGAVLWRLGGTKSDLTFVDDPLGGFSKQHAVKILPNGNVLLFDNGSDHNPPQSRAVEYRLDFAARTATMVWESRHDPILYAQFVGWVDRLSNGNTWVGYTFLGRVTEVESNGEVVWEGQLRSNGVNQSTYRIIPIAPPY